MRLSTVPTPIPTIRSLEQSRDIIEETVPSDRRELGAGAIASHSDGPAPKWGAFAGFCFGAAVDIADAALAKTYTKSSADEAAFTIFNAVYPNSFVTFGGLLESSGQGPTAYTFVAPASLPQIAKLADAGIEISVGTAVSQAVNAIGKALLSSHPQLLQVIDLVAGVVVVDLVKKEAHVWFDWYNRTGDQGEPPGAGGRRF